MDDIKQLRRWKEEALPILMAWDDVYEVLGGGLLGESKANVALREAKRLKASNADLLAACERAEVFLRMGDLLGQENRAASLLDTLEKLRAAIAKAKA